MGRKKKKKKRKDKIRERIKRRKMLEKEKQEKKDVRFRCLECGIEEDIPRSVVKQFDILDNGDISVPPRFDCEVCGGLMEPIEYTSVHGITYKIDEK
ncbi:hypothetical protein [Caldisalinibacter kiritimatiensis]|uniref:Uncharacterized protein n=1 Tax=Caldisalinibacter kiritimatiensis TaxID=1304284 RepID=R1CZ94_9FIRM|nr:hypothetical protein [Caldisalinibacter kiritimatiensis]EOD01894.1 hypothetical protein L21TH_0022 [Caldisalinibacter kiritimatiensis]